MKSFFELREELNNTNLDEISLSHLTKKIADSGGLKQVSKANKTDKLRKELEAMKKRLAAEEVEDDDMECPHCDMEDGEHDKDCPMMQEKTLTPAEKKKREEIAKAMERDNPNMPMAKKMAIATAQAKKVAEEVELDEAKSVEQQISDLESMLKRMSGNTSSMKMKKYAIQKKINNLKSSLDEAKRKGAPKMQGDFLKKERERNRAHDAAMGRTPTGRKKPQRAMTSTQRSLAKLRNEETQIDEVLDTPKAMDSYRNKAKYSKDRAANSAAAKILRGKNADGSRADHSPELKTMAKREKGLKMADKAATRKTFKALRNEETQIDELSSKTLTNYITKASSQAGKTTTPTKTQDKRIAGINKALKKANEEVEIDEAKSATGYTINHKTFSSAVQHAKAQVEKQGYSIDDDEWDHKVAMGPKKPGSGKTNRYTIDLMKGGKESRRKLQMQIYYDEGRYELNMYVS